MASNLKLLCNPTSKIVDDIVYRKNIGSLIYLENMRLDIFFLVNTLIQYIVEPRCVLHMVVENHVVWYKKHRIEYGLRHVRDHGIFLRGYDESHWFDNATNIKSTP